MEQLRQTEAKIETRHSLNCLTHNLATEIQGKLDQETTSKTLVVGVGGFTSLGKSSLAEKLAEHFHGKLTILPADSFMPDRAKKRELGTAGDNPSHIDFKGMVGALQKLIRGETTEVRLYDHSLGRYAETVQLSPAAIIILEGTLSLYPNIRGFVDLGVFFDADDDTKHTLAKSAFLADRNYNEYEFEQFWEVYQRDSKPFIDPTKETADIVVDVSEDWYYSTQLIKHCKRFGCN